MRCAISHVLVGLIALGLAPVALASSPFSPLLPVLPDSVRLPRWEAARIAISADGVRLGACLEDADACKTARLAAWRSVMIGLRGATPQLQIAGVNAFLNAIPYVADLDCFGTTDHWAGPLSFLAEGGDCEDYAIAKYATLRQLGFAADDLRILVVEDLAQGRAHAVLAVRATGQAWLLDNQAPLAVAPNLPDRYAAYYAVNEERGWLLALPAGRGSAP